MRSPPHPSLAADVADLFLVLAQWAIDPARPVEPTYRGAPGLLERLNGVHKETVPILGPVFLPDFESLFGGESMPALPTLVQRAAEASGETDTLPAYNTIANAIQVFTECLSSPLTLGQSKVARIMLKPLDRPGAVENLRAAIIGAAPASGYGFVHIISAWLHSARMDHPDSYVLGVQRQLVVDDGCLVRGDLLRQTVHAHRLLQADDQLLAEINDPVLRCQVRQLDTTLYLFAAQHAEFGQGLAKAGYDACLFDSIFRAPYSPREMMQRFFVVLRDYAGQTTWSALSLDGKPRVVGENNTSHEQLTKWRRGTRRMSLASLEKLVEHSPGFDPKRRQDDVAIFGEGYRMTLSVIAAMSYVDDAIADFDSDPRSVLLGRCHTYCNDLRADLGTWVPGPAFT